MNVYRSHANTRLIGRITNKTHLLGIWEAYPALVILPIVMNSCVVDHPPYCNAPSSSSAPITSSLNGRYGIDLSRSILQANLISVERCSCDSNMILRRLGTTVAIIPVSKWISFDYTFSKDTALCGPLDIMLSVSLTSSRDSDIYVYLEKMLPSGTVGTQLKIPYEKSRQSWLIRVAYKLRLTSDVDVLFYKGPKAGYAFTAE